MALSGTITGSTDNSRYVLTCEWSATQNTTANTSTITAIVYLNGNGYSTSSNYWCCSINGLQVTTNKSVTIGGRTELGRRTWTVNHNSNGTCSTTISFSYSNGLSSAGTYTTKSGSGSSNITLNTIARGSTFTLNRSSATLGTDSITLNITRTNSNYTHKVQLYFGSYSALLASNVTTSYTFTPNINLSSYLTTSTSGTATIKIQTMNGSTWIAESSKTITFNIPSTVVPSVGISVVANNTSNGINVANKTTFTVKATNASGTYGSTIKSYSITGGGLSSSASSATTGKLNAGNYTFTVKVTDSRGRVATSSSKVTVHSYSSPTVSVKCYRCNQDGIASDDGVYIGTSFSWQITNLANNNSNNKKYSISYKDNSSSNYTVSIADTNLDTYSGSTFVLLPDIFNTTSSYTIQFNLKDSYGVTTAYSTVSTVTALFNIERDGVGVGKIHERGALDIEGEVYSTDSIITENSIRIGKNKTYYGLDSNGNQIQMMRIASHNGVDVGYSGTNTAICSANSPTWWNGSASYDLFNSGNCTIISGSGGVSYRFANGLQINTMQVYGTWNITTTWGSVYSSPHITPPNYTQSFLTPPQVTVSAHGAGTAVMVCQAGSPTTTTPGTFYLWKPTQQTGVRDYIEIISIGRWK